MPTDKSRPVQLSSDIREPGNDFSEDLHGDGKMKLSSDSGQHEEEGQVMWKTTHNLASKENKGNISIISES